jgi:iron complex outermembrane recepter protein
MKKLRHVTTIAILLCARGMALADQATEPAPTQLPKMIVNDTVDSEYVAPIATTATKTDTPIMETPVNVQVITQQVLQDQQVIRIDQALKNVSGVTVGAGGDTSFGNAFDAVVIRGFQTDSHLRNGVRIDSFGGDTELFTQQLANVESIEVLKGPAAILYGAVEPGGVVNIITKQPQATPSYSADQQLGSYNLYRTSMDATGPLNEAATLLYRFDGSYDTSGSIVDLGFTRDLFIAPTLKLVIDPSTQATLEYEHKDSNFNGNYAAFPLIEAPSGQFLPLFNDPTVNFGERSALREITDLAGLHWLHSFNAQWSIKQQILVNLVHVDAPQVTADGIGPSDPSNPESAPAVYRVTSPFNTRDSTYASYVDLTGHFGTGGIQHSLLLGGDWYRFNSKFALMISNPSFSPDASRDSLINLFNPVHPGTSFGPLQPEFAGTGPTDSWGIHLQDQIALPENVFALLGVRYQHVYEANFSGQTLSSLTSTPLTGSAATPRVGVLWHPQSWVSVYGNYAKNWGPSNGYPTANGGIVPPTSARQKEVGAKFDLLGGRLTSTIAVYDLTKTNIPTPDPNNPCCFIVTGAVRSKGLELDVQGELSPGWNVIVNYSNIDARIVSSNDPGNPAGTQWFETPRLTGNLWTTYDFAPDSDRGFRVGGGVTYQGSQPSANYSGVPALQTTDYTELAGHATFGLMGGYRVSADGFKIKAQLNVSNLLNKRYFSYISLSNPQSYSTYTYDSAVYGFDRRLYGDPRTVVGSIAVQF